MQRLRGVRVSAATTPAGRQPPAAACRRLCDQSMTCFEPETLGNLIEGLEYAKPFSRSCFDLTTF